MELNSVRELKAALAAKVVPAAAESAMMRGPARALSLTLASPPAIALGVAPKAGGGYALAVRLQHRALEDGPTVKLITKQAKNEVDMRYIGMVGKRAAPWFQRRQRPLLIGCSVGHVKVTAGTLGAFVRPRLGGALAILSNNHVLANENRAKKGDAILQQASHDGGQDPDDVVATLASFQKLKRSGVNYVDCATAEILDGIDANTTNLKGLGKLKGLGSEFLDEGTKVAKLGRTTGLTRGRVTAFELDDVKIGFDTSDLRFDNTIEIEGTEDTPFSLGGDSGSLILDESGWAVGLLFAGSDQGGTNGQGLTYANPIRSVLDTLKVDLVF